MLCNFYMPFDATQADVADVPRREFELPSDSWISNMSRHRQVELKWEV